jgi:hypothetical protein
MKHYAFMAQFEKGELGVTLAKSVLRQRYEEIVDYDQEMRYQKLGIDLWVKKLGWVEVKTDFHESENFFFEYTVEDKPGAIFNSSANYICVIFPRERNMYLIPRNELQHWLAMNIHDILETKPGTVHKIGSYQGGKSWVATGITVPKERILRDTNGIHISWNEEDEVIISVWE